MSETNSIIDALKRLERAGDENSKTNAKLYKAAGDAGYAIAVIVDAAGLRGYNLPRGYVVRTIKQSEGEEIGLCKRIAEAGTAIDFELGQGGYVGAAGVQSLGRHRAIVAQFSEDLAAGLMHEIAEFIEQEGGSGAAILDQLTTHAPVAPPTP